LSIRLDLQMFAEGDPNDTTSTGAGGEEQSLSGFEQFEDLYNNGLQNDDKMSKLIRRHSSSRGKISTMRSRQRRDAGRRKRSGYNGNVMPYTLRFTLGR